MIRYELHRMQSIPKYVWIADRLQAEIETGKYRQGRRLPSEAELCRRFNENRYTIRQALELLVHAGLIRAEQGKGHFVCEKPLDIQYVITPGTRFSKVISQLGCQPGAILLNQEECCPPPHVAQHLQLAEHDPVYRLEILRLADDVPLAWNETWLPAVYFPGLLQHTNPFHSLYDLLENIYHIRMHRIRSYFQAKFPTAREVMYLEVSPNTSLLHIESVVQDDQFRRVEFTTAKYRGDLCKVAIRFDSAGMDEANSI